LYPGLGSARWQTRYPFGLRQKKARPLKGGLTWPLPSSVSNALAREFVARLVVMLGMQLARLVGMVLGMQVVGPRDIGMVGGLLVVAGRVSFGGGVVVSRGALVVGCGVLVMLDLVLVGHVIFCY
jgi:hypothetical protein